MLLFTQHASLCRLNKLKLTNANQRSLRTLNILGENHDSCLINARERITKENAELHMPHEKIKSLNNRVSGVHLSSKGPKTNHKFLPILQDQQRQRSNFIILTARIWVDYFDAMSPLKDACMLHMPHKCTKELTQKSRRLSSF